jgi:MEKHLA domain
MTEPKVNLISLATDPHFFRLLTESYERLVGTPLVPEGSDAAWLYERAPFVVVAHDTSADPRFIYANRAAQACFEYDWNEFTTLPSRLSAESASRNERQKLLDAVTAQGFIFGYRGLRIAKTGRRFWIEQCVVWNLVDEKGHTRGQAATFPSLQNV